MELPHAIVETPVFMPVGTQGTLKGLLPIQLEQMDCRIMLGNTYHLGNRPGVETMQKERMETPPLSKSSFCFLNKVLLF